MFVCAELIEEAGRPILSEMDPLQIWTGGSISDKSYFAWQKWTPLSITLPFVFKFKFDNAIENNVILSFIPRI